MRQTLITSDKAQLEYRLQASAHAEAQNVVLIHALGMDDSNWDRVLAVMPDHLSAVAINVRGHGRSGRGSLPLTIDTAVDDVLRVMEQLSWPTATVAGCSMGGCIAQAVAIRRPEKVSGLVLVDTTAWYGEKAATNWGGRAERAASKGFQSLLDFQKDRWFSPSFLERQPEAFDKYAEVFLANDVRTYQEACAMLGSIDLRDGLEHVQVPTAILVGEDDYATPPEMARQMHALLPDASLEILDGARHFTPIEAPRKVAHAIARVAVAGASVARFNEV